MKKLLLLCLVLLGGVMQVSAKRDICLHSDVTTWGNDDYKFEWKEWTGTEDVYEYTIDTSSRTEDIYLRLHFPGWTNDVRPYKDHLPFSFNFGTNGISASYNDVYYNSSEYQGNDSGFVIPQSSIKASGYKILIYDNPNYNKLSIVVDILTMPVTISAGKATFSCDRALNFYNTGINAYMITGASNGVLTPSDAMSLVPANTGLYLEGSNGTVKVPVVTNEYASENVNTSGNMLVAGTGSSISTTTTIGTTTYTNYILTKNTVDSPDDPLRFYKVNSTYGNTVPKGKAYLQIPPGIIGGARDSFWFGDETTGIANVDVNAEFDANAPMYNLAGQRVSKNYKGVVIQNGKKMLMK